MADTVGGILQRVFVEGDAVLIELAQRFDGADLSGSGVLVTDTEFIAYSEDAYDLRGSCGFSFGNGCSGGETDANLFGKPKRAKNPMEI